MANIQKLKFKTMGVINITPDSFSDGNIYNSSHEFALKFKDTVSKFDIVDIGAESTAPFNNVVALDAELDRYGIFEKYCKNNIDPESVISIDSYKPLVFIHVYKFLKTNWPKTKVIWNDVSGKIDEGFNIVIDTIGNDFEYVFCHNLAPTREQSSEHMDFQTNENIGQHVDEYFLKAVDRLNQCEITYYLDPCFGFSKTREQNHQLLLHMKDLIVKMPTQSFVYGVSRKSFLRFPSTLDIKDEETLIQVDSLHALLLNELLDFNLIVRCHSLAPINALYSFCELTGRFTE